MDMNTAMDYGEGDLDTKQNDQECRRRDPSLRTLDRYLAGRHDKMVKTIIHIVSPDERVMEIYAMPGGEEDTQVVESQLRARSRAPIGQQASSTAKQHSIRKKMPSFHEAPQRPATRLGQRGAASVSSALPSDGSRG
ncbi:MAG: hypothetical protein ACI82F_004179 [Planctomycetota bacterium]|jgi:hypothetical protein